MKNKKMSDDSKAAWVILIWEFFFYFACLFDIFALWITLGIVTAIEIIYVFIDDHREKKRKISKKELHFFRYSNQEMC